MLNFKVAGMVIKQWTRGTGVRFLTGASVNLFSITSASVWAKPVSYKRGAMHRLPRLGMVNVISGCIVKFGKHVMTSLFTSAVLITLLSYQHIS
jgi:hypothetical protein